MRVRLASGPGPPALVGTASEEGVVSPSADPMEPRPNGQGWGRVLPTVAEARDGGMERSHVHWAAQM